MPAVSSGNKAAKEGHEGKSLGAAPAAPERITVALIPKAAEDLQRLQDRSGLSKTDITNRAISLYEFIEAQLQAGKEVLIRDPEAGETQRVFFL